MKTFRFLILIAAMALMALTASAEPNSAGGQAAQAQSSHSAGGQAAQPQKGNPAASGQASQPQAGNPANSLPFRGPPEAENPRPYFPTDDLKSSTPAANDSKQAKPAATPPS